MFTCLKCGRKLKTLHERVYGDRPHYVPVGYHCETCRIYYDAKSKKTSQAVYGVSSIPKVAKHNTPKNEQGGIIVAATSEANKSHANAALNAYEIEQERIRLQVEPITATNNAIHETMRRPGFEPGLPDWQSDVLDQTGRPSH